ncbi:MAG: hypothetical protein WC208_10560 [Gallionella sp.]|jgi:hypothetical protein
MDAADKGIIREYMKEFRQPMGEPVIIKVWLSTVAGDPTKGIATTFTWRLDADFVVVTAIQQKDMIYSGGIYQLGDIKVNTTRKLQPMDDAAGTVGDRLVWRGHEYRQIGNIDTSYVNEYVLYTYVFRRI